MLTLEYTKNYCKEMLRNPSALFFTLFFPAVLLSVFGSNGNTHDATEKFYTYIIYCNFAVQTVMLQALGIAVSNERASEWTMYLKTLPVTIFPSIAGRVLSSLLFSVISLSVVIATNAYLHPLHIPLYQHTIVIACALIGSIPMALLAILLARFLNATAARGAFVLVNTLLLFGSFAFTTNDLVAHVSTFIPSYDWLMFSVSASMVSKNFLTYGAWLLGYALLFYFMIQLVDKNIPTKSFKNL